jgi:hypothetical protein
MLKKPTTQTQEMLYLLLKRKSITRMQVLNECGMLNPTARIANLRNKYGIDVECTPIKRKNKFGRAITYGSWSIKNKAKAENIYKKMLQD